MPPADRRSPITHEDLKNLADKLYSELRNDHRLFLPEVKFVANRIHSNAVQEELMDEISRSA